LRKFILLVAGIVLSVATLSACTGGKPPPPPTDPRDVLVVGDSVSFAFGCVLGDNGGAIGNDCPPPADGAFTARNEFSGACTITPGTLMLYNAQLVPAPSCDTNPTPQHGRTWEQAADHYTPKVVVIVTAGWEVVDRYVLGSGGGPVPELQWAGPGSTADNAAAWYSNYLLNAINMFRSRGAKVLVANAANFDPPAPLPDSGPSACMWWEPFDDPAPTSAGPCNAGQAWRSPPGFNVGYRSSNTKIDQFNDVINIVKTNWFGGDSNVRIFNFKSHFNGPADGYTDYVCPPPDDDDITPIPDITDGTPNCPTVAEPTRNAILARAPDKGHLSLGGNDILDFYLEPCVRDMLGISGGDPAKCT
jgi:hypothetical protein